MIIPARWFAGGKGLNDFRDSMLNDNRIRTLVDFSNASEVFPGVDIAGGICYFLWDRDNGGDCKIVNLHKGNKLTSVRPLNEFDTLVRYGIAVDIIKKVKNKSTNYMSDIVSSRKPFGLSTNIRPSKKGELILIWNGGEGPFSLSDITTGHQLIPLYKVLTSKVSYDHAGQPNKDGKRRVLSKVFIAEPNSICTETYLVAGAFTTRDKAENLMIYLKSKFLRFLVAQLSFSQDITKTRFSFVPELNTDRKWTDEDLYKKFELTHQEILFIENSILEME